MSDFRCSMILLFLLFFFLNHRFFCLSSLEDEVDYESSIMLYHHDYSPPSPPPPPPHPPTVSCDGELEGVGNLDTTCQIVSDLNLTDSVYIQGRGNFFILPNVKVDCSAISGCEIAINISGHFSLGENSTIIAGAFDLTAGNATLREGSLINTTGLAGDPPSATSGSPVGLDGSGGGHGGRGASCLIDETKDPEDFWGGDTYSWSSLDKPWSFGSKGGSTSKTVDYGGGGGGKVRLHVSEFLVVNAQVMADGGEGGNKGGGGSGGSIHIMAYKM